MHRLSVTTIMSPLFLFHFVAVRTSFLASAAHIVTYLQAYPSPIVIRGRELATIDAADISPRVEEDYYDSY